MLSEQYVEPILIVTSLDVLAKSALLLGQNASEFLSCQQYQNQIESCR